MTEQQKVAIANVQKAVAGKPAGSYATVQSDDVVAVSELVKDGDKVTDAIRAGALGAGSGATIHQLTWQLSHVLGKTGAT